MTYIYGNTDIVDQFEPDVEPPKVNLRKNHTFEVFLTPLKLPFDETVLGVSYGDLSNRLRDGISCYSVDYKNKTVHFEVLQDGITDLAFIKAMQEPGVKEILIYNYNPDKSLHYTLVVTVLGLSDYNLQGQKEVIQFDSNTTFVELNATVDFRIK